MAKNLFLWSGRSWPRKALEAWFTGLIELLWPKQRILEVYLNSVEWGDGVFGAEAAARHHFKVAAPYLFAPAGQPAGRRAAQSARLERQPPGAAHPAAGQLDPPAELSARRQPLHQPAVATGAGLVAAVAAAALRRNSPQAISAWPLK